MRILAILGLGIGCGWASGANAQLFPEYHFLPELFGDEVPRGETVRSRQRPELDALGMHVGGFFFFPSVTNSIAYNDNIFATDGGETSDLIYVLSPRSRLVSDWNRHAIDLSAGGDLGFYFDETDENFRDAQVAAAGRLDIKTSTTLRGNLGFRREHEARSDPDDVGGSEPTVFRRFDAGIEGVHRFNRVSVSAGSNIEVRDYDDTPQGSGLPDINNDDRNRYVVTPGVQVGYDFSPGYQAFVRGDGRFVEYTDQDDAGLNRNSKGYDIVGGANVDLTGLLFGEFFVGIRQRFFEEDQFDTITGPVVGSKLTWIPTGLTTVTLNLRNQIIETTSTIESGYTSTAVDLGVDHELLRNLLLNGGLGYRLDSYDSTTREEHNFAVTLGANYLWNRYLTLGGRYAFRYRNSNQVDSDFTRNVFLLSLRAQL